MSRAKFKISKIKEKSKFVKNNGYNNLYPCFSFSNYIEDPRYFSKENSNEERNSLFNFFQKIKAFSTQTWGEISQKKDIFHFHSIEKDIPVLNEYDSVDLTQFKIPGCKQGRFIGFFDENNIFNILLYDSQHTVYSRK